MSTPTRITHLVDGAAWEGTAERTSPVFNPATGEQTGVLDLASADLVDEVVATAPSRPGPGVGRGISLAKRTQVLFAFRELLNERKQEIAALITAEHGKVLSDAARRGDPWPRGRRVRLRHPAPAEGRLHRERLDQGRRLLDPPAASASSPSSRPFNFPAMVPMWFVPIAIACGNAVVLKPSEKDPSAALAVAALWKEAGLPDGVMNVVQRRQGGGRRPAHPPRHQVGVVRRLHPDRQVRLRDRHRARQAGPGPRRREEPHARPARTPTSTSPPTPPSTPASARPASAAWPSRPSSPSSRSPTSWSRRSRTGWASSSPATAPAAATWARWSPAQHRDKVTSYLDAGVADGRDARRRRPRRRLRRRRRGLLPRADAVRQRRAGHVDLRRRDLRPGPVGRAGALVRRGRWSSSTPTPTATARRSSPTTAARRAGSRTRSRSAWSASTCRSRCRWRTTRSAAGRTRLFGDTHAHGMEGVHFFTRGKVVTSRWLDPSHGGLNLGFPQNA